MTERSGSVQKPLPGPRKRLFRTHDSMSTKITLNGEPFTAEAGTSVAALLGQLELRKNRVAVEINREVLPKAEYDHTMLNDGDVVEVINFVGGG